MNSGRTARGARAFAMTSLVLAMLSFAVFLAMAYPWQLAVLAATAIGAFVYSIQSTWKRMCQIARPLESNDLAIGRGFSQEAGKRASVGRIED